MTRYPRGFPRRDACVFFFDTVMLLCSCESLPLGGWITNTPEFPRGYRYAYIRQCVARVGKDGHLANPSEDVLERKGVDRTKGRVLKIGANHISVVSRGDGAS